MEPQPNLVLLTGASGWLGRSLLEVLVGDRSDEALPWQPAAAVRALVPSETEAQRLRPIAMERVELVVGNLTNPRDCARFVTEAQDALLFHCAGVIHPRRVADFYAVNVEGAGNLLDAAAAAGVGRVVIVSSNSPFGFNRRRDERFDELTPYRPYMNYGRSKMLMEMEALRRADRGGPEVVVLRPPWFYGPHQPVRQTRFLRMVRRGIFPLVGDGRNLRSMVYLDNLIQGLFLAATVPEAAGRAYWIADRRPYPMVEVIETVRRLMSEEFELKSARRTIRVPALVSDLARVGDWAIQRSGLYSERVHVLSELSRTIACSSERAERELGYRPTVALEEGMRRSIRWALTSGVEL